MAEFRWERLHVERIGDQIHVWGLDEPLDESVNCHIEWCHVFNGPDDEPNPTPLLVIHTGAAHHD